MKTKILFLSLAFIVTLASCSKEADLTSKATNAQTSADYKIEDGTIKFKNKEAYIKAYQKLSTASDEEISNWNKQLSFKTLKTKTEEDIKNQNPEIAYDSLLINSPSHYNQGVYSIANSAGEFWVGDTIMKVMGEQIYLITDGDKSKLSIINSNTDCSQDKKIIKRLIIANQSQKFKVSAAPVNGLMLEYAYADKISYKTLLGEYSYSTGSGWFKRTVTKKEYIALCARLISSGVGPWYDQLKLEITNWVYSPPINGLIQMQSGSINVVSGKYLDGKNLTPAQIGNGSNTSTVTASIFSINGDFKDVEIRYDFISKWGKCQGPATIVYSYNPSDPFSAR